MKSFVQNITTLYDIVYDSALGFIDDDALTHAAAVSYFVILSIIPFIVLAVSVFSYFFGDTSEAYNWLLFQVNNFSPEIVYKYDFFIKKLTDEIINIRGTALGFGVISLVWIGMNTVSSLENSLNVVLKIQMGRNYIKRKLISFLLILLLFIVLYLTTFYSAIINASFHEQENFFKLLNIDITKLWYYITLISPIFVYFLVFLLIYIFLPRVRMPYKAIIISSALASITWAVAKNLFSWFIIHISQYSKLYGSIAGLMIIVIWLYFSIIIIIFYGEMIFAIKNKIQINP